MYLNFSSFIFILKEDLADLKEQITLYESAVKHGVIALDLSSDWENQLSESCVDLGLKKTIRKNGVLHRYAMIMEQSHCCHYNDSQSLCTVCVLLSLCREC